MTAGLKAIFLAERPMLLRLLTARMRDPDLAEDVLQEVWLKLDVAASGPIADPAAYLYRMANNLAFDKRRSDIRRSGREGVWLSTQADEADEPDAERQLLAREKLVRLQAAISALPERTAHIFRRYRLDGIPRRDIAIEEGISVSAVEKHLKRAYQVVQTIKSEEGADF
jgi:RNA polymerase sigma factor (sigma-70 family)